MYPTSFPSSFFWTPKTRLIVRSIAVQVRKLHCREAYRVSSLFSSIFIWWLMKVLTYCTDLNKLYTCVIFFKKTRDVSLLSFWSEWSREIKNTRQKYWYSELDFMHFPGIGDAFTKFFFFFYLSPCTIFLKKLPGSSGPQLKIFGYDTVTRGKHSLGNTALWDKDHGMKPYVSIKFK